MSVSTNVNIFDAQFFRNALKSGLIISPSKIFKAILQSKEDGRLIGIKAEHLGTKTMVGTVDEILMNGLDTIVLLKKHDAPDMKRTYKIDLLSIQSVYSIAPPRDSITTKLP